MHESPCKYMTSKAMLSDVVSIMCIYLVHPLFSALCYACKFFVNSVLVPVPQILKDTTKCSLSRIHKEREKDNQIFTSFCVVDSLMHAQKNGETLMIHMYVLLYTCTIVHASER